MKAVVTINTEHLTKAMALMENSLKGIIAVSGISTLKSDITLSIIEAAKRNEMIVVFGNHSNDELITILSKLNSGISAGEKLREIVKKLELNSKEFKAKNMKRPENQRWDSRKWYESKRKRR